MPWIKRNLFFVAGGLAALVLLGVAGFFFFSNWRHDKTVTDELNQQIAELNRLYNADPHPGTEEINNVAAAKQDEKRVQEFLADAQQLFVPVKPYQKTDDRGFNNLLLNTIYELQVGASNAGVILQTNYSFTFSAQRGKLSFAPGSIEPWTAQLSEIKTICGILYKAKINALEGLRRVPVSPDDQGGETTDYLNASIITNDIAVVTPYEVTFRSFSEEIGSVLDGILRATNCLIVKTIMVEPSKAIIGGDPNAPMSQGVFASPAYTPQPLPSRSFESTYGLGPGARAVPAPVPGAGVSVAGRPAAPSGPTVFLSEKPLHVTMMIDVVKIKPPQQ